ncbi:MAG: acetyl-CoA carboxylase biotin carboxyl carrier protein subunit [Ekhidna sp.]|nr:acetyl-CoA carboxylase biotin carboxyl carrier protein subunit [Ekhidna sp.]
MLRISINESKTVEVGKEGNTLLINGNEREYELVKKSENAYVIIFSKKIYNIEILSFEGKEAIISINNQVSKIKISDHIDQILKKLGMDKVQSSQVQDIKAPMPGSIMNVIVKENDQVQSGDTLLVLEAMKMENVIKSSRGGRVGKVHVSEGENVEKNQVLITFD